MDVSAQQPSLSFSSSSLFMKRSEYYSSELLGEVQKAKCDMSP